MKLGVASLGRPGEAEQTRAPRHDATKHRMEPVPRMRINDAPPWIVPGRQVLSHLWGNGLMLGLEGGLSLAAVSSTARPPHRLIGFDSVG